MNGCPGVQRTRAESSRTAPGDSLDAEHQVAKTGLNSTSKGRDEMSTALAPEGWLELTVSGWVEA
jgi:hypothetical protein